MIEIKAPNLIECVENQPIVFLAGSIEMGFAEPWQDRIVKDLGDKNVYIFNPRRDDWDSSWKQCITNPQFNEQVNWELDHLERADIVVFYFDPHTRSPITLMELGYTLGMIGNLHKDVIVCCPDGFWRKGNVQIICEREQSGMVTLVNTYDHLIVKLIDEINAEWRYND